ncbi:MAG: protease complex subunit PrcB family protein [Spirochaetales bacterium]|nr:protease complex subunit PrcB family protein [Spirochaetales bacterium]
MKKIILPSLALWGILWGLFACATVPENSSAQDDSSPEETLLVSPEEGDSPFSEEGRLFEDAGLGFTGPSEQEFCLFLNREELLRYISPEDLFREIDFSREMVLACFMGEKPSGGYMNRIVHIEEGTETLTVYVEVTEPAPGDLVAQMVTSPWHGVVTELSDKSIEWSQIRADD